MPSGWFSMSLHALAVLSQSKEGYTSCYIAGSVNTNAVFLRRVLARLVKAGIIETREGRDGGYRLAKPANQITLAEVYKAMELENALAPSPAEPNPACPVGAGISLAFDEIALEVEKSIIQTLEKYTVEQIADRAIQFALQKGDFGS